MEHTKFKKRGGWMRGYGILHWTDNVKERLVVLPTDTERDDYGNIIDCDWEKDYCNVVFRLNTKIPFMQRLREAFNILSKGRFE